MVKPCSPRPTVQCVDTYCELYRDLFIEVRAYESFKYLQLGLISDLKKEKFTSELVHDPLPLRAGMGAQIKQD